MTADYLTAPENFDAGMRNYILGIYNYMALALLMTGMIAYVCAQSGIFINAMYLIQDNTITGMKPLAWMVMFAPLWLAIYLSFALQRMSLRGVQLSYWLYAVLMGLSLSVVFLGFAGDSIAHIFFITAGMFSGMSFYGYKITRGLNGLGAFLIMALWGLIIASLVNLFLQSSGMQFALSIIGVLIFSGLTAYDTQKLRRLYYILQGDEQWRGKSVVMGALTLYLDFINIFLNLLTLFGRRKK